jgi:hypothetical protein
MVTLDFAHLSPNERVRLWLAAAARGDSIERQRTLDTAKRSTVTMREPAFQERLDTLLDAATALRMALLGPIEVGELLSGILAPTSFWPEEMDESKWPRPTVLNQYLAGIADRSIWRGPDSVLSMDDSTFSSSLEVADRATQGVLQAADAALCEGLVSANSKAWGIIKGITQWCESISLSADDFLTWYCQDLLDRLDQQRSTVLQARERLTNFKRSDVWSLPTPESEADSNDFQDYEPGIAKAFAEAWLETFPIKNQK